mmetsp:Transcript_18982/g.25694  ORF Transcript_18982/g.25694 Transcript_18982/m.25694 type:complete len:80 (+) Transcript_18982:2149-2388(+)
MELVIDNIKLLHLNSKLVEYCKRQVTQSEFAMKSMEQKVEHTNTHVEQSSNELNQMQEQLDELRSKNETLSKLLENERG